MVNSFNIDITYIKKKNSENILEELKLNYK